MEEQQENNFFENLPEQEYRKKIKNSKIIYIISLSELVIFLVGIPFLLAIFLNNVRQYFLLVIFAQIVNVIIFCYFSFMLFEFWGEYSIFYLYIIPLILIPLVASIYNTILVSKLLKSDKKN